MIFWATFSGLPAVFFFTSFSFMKRIYRRTGSFFSGMVSGIPSARYFERA